MPPFLADDRSGLVLCGKGSNAKADTLSRQSTSLLFSDPAAYNQVATAEEPFALPTRDGALFGSDLDAVLQGQLQCHAAAAITSSRYVQAGDSAAFKALVRHAQTIDRDDVIVAIPVALSWLIQTQIFRSHRTERGYASMPSAPPPPPLTCG